MASETAQEHWPLTTGHQTARLNTHGDGTRRIMGLRIKQFSAAAAAYLSAYTCGLSFGWASPGLHKLMQQNETSLTHVINTVEESWIGSLLALGASIGPFPAAYAVDRIGRKSTLLCSMGAFYVAWFLILTTSNLVQIYAARFLIGIGVGAVFTSLVMYIGEIAEDSIRGSMSSMMELFITSGLLTAYVTGPFLSFFWFGVVCVTPAIVFFAIFSFFPESPHYLVRIGKHEEAKEALKVLRGIKEDEARKQLEEIQKYQEESSKRRANLQDVIRDPVGRRCLLLSLGLISGQQFSGNIVVVFYTQDIFDATGSSLASEYCTMIVGAVVMMSSFVTPTVVELSGRKMLLYFSGIGMALFLAVLGLYYWFYNNGYDVRFLGALPVTSLVFVMLSYCVGFGPLPWAIMNEIFTLEMKSASLSFAVFYCWIVGFLLTKYFASVALALGMAGAFWIFSGCCIAMTVFVYLLLPETKGKSLQLIQREILSGRGVAPTFNDS